MALVNDAKREINAKIVYIGSKGAGKGTALRQIYGRLKPECRSELKSMAIGEHQMVFFDFAYPALVRGDYSIRFHVYTLLAGAEMSPPWKMLLKGADGVVLFADSSEGSMYANLESCTVLLDSLAHYGRKLADIALSLQCNKRDLRGALPLEIMSAELFPEGPGEPVAVTATTGDGLLEGLNSLVSRILVNLGEDRAVASIVPVTTDELSAAPRPQSATGQDEDFTHCSADTPGLTVEIAGDPIALDSSTIIIPLRVSGAGCGKSAEFKVTVSVAS